MKKQIIDLEVEPGQKISEKEYAAKLEVSRTPVREAFMKLAEEELIGVYPQSGTIVSLIDLDLVEEGRFIREKIECAIVKEACDVLDKEQLFQLETNLMMQELSLEKESYHRLFELDDEFHRLLFEGCKKIRTWKMVRQLNCHFDRLRILRLASNSNWKVVVNQHRSIYQSVVDKNKTRAKAGMIEHLRLVILEKEPLKKNYPSYFK